MTRPNRLATWNGCGELLDTANPALFDALLFVLELLTTTPLEVAGTPEVAEFGDEPTAELEPLSPAEQVHVLEALARFTEQASSVASATVPEPSGDAT